MKATILTEKKAFNVTNAVIINRLLILIHTNLILSVQPNPVYSLHCILGKSSREVSLLSYTGKFSCQKSAFVAEFMFFEKKKDFFHFSDNFC